VDVERTIDFILKSQANAERRMDRIDTRLDGISKLLQQGMRMLVKTDTTLSQLAQAQKRTELKLADLAEAQKRTNVRLADLAEAQKRTDTALAELAEAHKETEQTLKTFIKSLGNGRNGRTSR
jgi:hypothetical protein